MRRLHTTARSASSKSELASRLGSRLRELRDTPSPPAAQPATQPAKHPSTPAEQIPTQISKVNPPIYPTPPPHPAREVAPLCERLGTLAPGGDPVPRLLQGKVVHFRSRTEKEEAVHECVRRVRGRIESLPDEKRKAAEERLGGSLTDENVKRVFWGSVGGRVREYLTSTLVRGTYDGGKEGGREMTALDGVEALLRRNKYFTTDDREKFVGKVGGLLQNRR